jgi:DNA helicase-2/ATP-dependent DNA helicase PcrA
MSLQPQFSERAPADGNGPASAPYWEEPRSSPYWDAAALAEHNLDAPEAVRPDAPSPAILQGLNEAQQQAVLHTEGPLLIVAGPGSGKTRVITHRIAYLVEERGVEPWRILAVTFTNKAAREMRDRLDRLLPSRSEAVTMGTFHAVCARILRRHGDRVGLSPNFTIYDQDDQIDAVKSAMRLAEVDNKRYSPRAILSRISAAKSTLQNAQQMRETAYSAEDEYGAHWIDVCSRVYHYYEEALTLQNALDFDDLLVRTASLLQHEPQVQAQYHDRYQYLLIDEFQDTNIAQYRLARLLTGAHQNLCVVGDPDQSIYSWRNADIRNILSFQSDFPDCTVVSLGENYRSTQNILNAAASVIAANTERIERRLFTSNPVGRPITFHEAYSEEDEALWAADEVGRLIKAGSYRAGDCAIMYRVNAQSRAFEDQCMRQGLPYRLVGGVRFYHRKEIKDAVCYLRVVYNPGDEVSLQRVINVPPRGIGAKTVQQLNRYAGERGITTLTAMHQIAAARAEHLPCPIDVTARAAKSIADLAVSFERLTTASRELPVADLLDRVLDLSGLARQIQADEDREERWDNVQELRGLAEDYGPSPEADGLGAFLERVSLVSDVDSYEPSDDALTLITLHQAKGLEFPVVMMAGMEEGLLPHSRSLDTIKEIEEERRLCYVGMTRAKERLYLLRAFRRRFPSNGGVSLPSRFLQDIPDDVLASAALDRPPGSRADVHPLNPSRPSRNEDAVIGGDWSTARRESRTRLGDSGDGATGAATRGRLRGNIDEKLTEWTASRSVRPSEPERIPLGVGEIVRHPVFGEGVVQEVQGSGDDEQASINFANGIGLKRLLVSIAPLQRG